MMFLLEEFKQIKTGKKDVRKFVFLMAFILLSLGGYLAWHSRLTGTYLLCGALLLSILGLLWPLFLKPFYFVWMGLAVILGVIISRVILIVTFYLVITPIGFSYRIFTKFFIPKNTLKSYWISKQSRIASKEDYEKQF